MKKKFFAVAAFAIAFAVAFSASAYDLGSTTLKRGSTGMAVSQMQTALNVCNGAGLSTDGAFGRMSESAVKAFQTSKGLTADGKVGNMTKMALNACSGTTTGSSTVPGCAAGAMFSSTTGASCSTSTSWGTSSAEGYLADFALDSTNRVTTVYESESDKVVAGFRTTARLSDQKVERVQVQFDQSDTNSGLASANFAKYTSSVSLWYGSTKIATMAVADASRNTSTDVYTFNFTGLNAVVAKDQIGRFYVSVNANGSIDSNDAAGGWSAYFPTGAVRSTSPNGVYQTYDVAGQGAVAGTSNLAGSAYTFAYGKFSTSGIKATVGLSSSNPASSTVGVSSTTSNTNGVELLRFTIKATNSDLHLRKIPIQIVSASENVADIINTIYLKSGSNPVDSVDSASSYTVSAGAITTTADATLTTAGFYFSNLAAPYDVIPAGTTAEFSVVADLKGENSDANFQDGETLTTSFANADVLLAADFSVQDNNGDQLTNNSSTIRVGSAVGNVITLRANGVNTVMGTPSYSSTTATSGDVTSVTYTIPVAVTAYGNTLYIGQSAQLATTATASNAFGLVFQNSSAPTTPDVGASATITFATSDAAIETNGFRLDSGITKHFTVTVRLNTPTTVNNSYRVALKTVRTFTDGGLTTGTSSTLLPVEAFQTGYQFINN